MYHKWHIKVTNSKFVKIMDLDIYDDVSRLIIISLKLLDSIDTFNVFGFYLTNHNR